MPERTIWDDLADFIEMFNIRPTGMEQIEKAEVEDCIYRIFNYIKDNRGENPRKREVEAMFWEHFFEYFKNLDKTEQNRILNQLADVVVEHAQNNKNLEKKERTKKGID